MRRLWLIFAQTVTICLGALFFVSVLRPDWLPGYGDMWPSSDRSSQTGEGRADPAASRAPAEASYAPAVARAAPSVVNVYTTKHVDVPLVPLPSDPALQQLLRGLPGFTRREASTSLGSGVIVRGDGYILTNYHVIEAADAIEVSLRDGRQASAKVVGADPDSDLAVLRVDLEKLPVIAFDPDHQVRIGDVVLAIGNPFGVGQTTTMGIVSALGRDRPGINLYENFIQTDAAINPGNSGGALIDTQGELVGINTAIYSRSGGSLGIGFAIPAPAAHRILEQIIEYGEVRRGWLGVEPQDITPDLARAFGLKDLKGAIVARVVRGGPGARAGIQVGDIIQAVDKEPVSDSIDLLKKLAPLTKGTEVKLDVLRAGKHVTLTVEVGLRPTQRIAAQ